MSLAKLPFRKVTSLSIAFFMLILISCDKDETIIYEEEDVIVINEEDIELNNETLLFQMDYVNFAWGFRHYGWYINNEGEMRAYSSPVDWKLADESDYFDHDDLLQNYSQADKIIAQIDLDEIKEKSKLIEGTLNGELSEQDCPGADQGSFNLYCYYWDEEKNKYKQQFLSTSGDCNQVNTTKEAQELIEFLNQWIDITL